MSSAVLTLQRLYKLDIDAFPIEGVRRGLERAGKQAPDDDRVWLARATWRSARATSSRRIVGSRDAWPAAPKTRRSGE